MTPCWPWAGTIGGKGYGQRRGIDGQSEYAHRATYEALVGPIPDGLTLDHLCRNRACVNPDHLEPVTLKVNILRGEGPAAINARKTECVNGHPFDEANTILRPHGWRGCRACKRTQSRDHMRRKRASTT